MEQYLSWNLRQQIDLREHFLMVTVGLNATASPALEAKHRQYIYSGYSL